MENRNEMIERIEFFDNFKDPGFCTETVGHVLGCEYSDKRITLTNFDFSSVPTSTLEKVTKYIELALDADIAASELWEL